MVISFNSCQKTENEKPEVKNELKSASISSGAPVIYWGPVQFSRETSKPVTSTQNIENKDFLHFENNFVLQIQNGNGSNFQVTSAIIKIDGKQIVGPSDFSKKVKSISKKLEGLTSTSVIEVELGGAPGSYLSIWIEGTLKLELPTITTAEITAITDNSATSGGNITNDGGSAITSRGVCWGTSENHTVLNTKSLDGNGISAFTSNITNLASNTTFYVRSFATNSLGTTYGNQLSFYHTKVNTFGWLSCI